MPQLLHRTVTDKNGPALVPGAGQGSSSKEMPAACEATAGTAGGGGGTRAETGILHKQGPEASR